MWVLCGVAGLGAGVITTVAGMGGGLMLLLVLTAGLGDPVCALVITSPALLVGNTHRAWLYADEVDGALVWRLALGMLPASFAAGLWVSSGPVAIIRWAMLAVAAMALIRGLGLWSWHPPRRWASGVGVVAGMVNATAGGAGIVLAPYLLGRELEGRSYVGTMATCGAVLHLSRLGAYGVGGVVDEAMLWNGIALAFAVAAGNLLGHRVRPAASTQRQLQLAVLVGCAVLAATGLG